MLRFRGIAASRLVARMSTVSGPSMLDLSKFANPEEPKERLPQEALDRDIQLRQEHFSMRSSFPDSAQPKDGPPVDIDLAYRKRLIYRAKQRGWLEVDLLLGSWAVDNIMHLSVEECKEFEAILNCETLDIYNMITQQMDIPKVLQTPMMGRLQEYATTSPAGVASPTMYAKLKGKMSN